jgi:H+/Cl- antiporter ClcA
MQGKGPQVAAVAGALVVVAAVGLDTLLLAVPAIRNGLWTYLAVVPGLALAGVAAAKRRSWLTVPLAAVALLAAAGYTVVRFLPTPSAPPAVGVGQAFPDFTLRDAANRDVSLAELRRDGPVVVVLYRGFF